LYFSAGRAGRAGRARCDAIAQNFCGAEVLRYGAEKFALRGETGQILRSRAGQSGENGFVTPSRKKK